MPTFTNNEVSKYARRILEDMSFLQEAVTSNIASGNEDDPVTKEYDSLMMVLWTCRHKIDMQVEKLEDAVEQAKSEGAEHVTDARRNNSYAPQSPNYGLYPPTERDEEGSPHYEPQSPHNLPTSPAPHSRSGHSPIYQLPVSPRYEPSSPFGYQPTSPRYEPTSPNYQAVAAVSSPLLPDYESPSLLHQNNNHHQQATNNIFPHNSANSDSGFVDLTTPSPDTRPQRPFWLLPPATGEEQAVNQQQTKKRRCTPPPPGFFAAANNRPSWGRSASLHLDDGSSGEYQQAFDDVQAAEAEVAAAAPPQFRVNSLREEVDAFVQNVSRLAGDDQILSLWLGVNGGEDEGEQKADGGDDDDDGDEVQFLGCSRKRPAVEAPMYGARSAVRRRLI